MGDFVSKGCANYVFTVDNVGTQDYMLLMMPPPKSKYNAHVHVHSITGSPTVSIVEIPSFTPAALPAPSDVDLNINQGEDFFALAPGNSVTLHVVGTSSLWVFVDRCVEG